MSKIPVSALYENCEMMLHDKWGYIWGTAGVKCTQAVINKAIDRHPSTADITKKYGPKWLGRMVTDCSGVMVYIWHLFGKTIPHGSSSMVSKKYIVDCSDTPHPGYAALVDPTPETDDNNHIGIVSEDGKYVYEAKGTQYGFVKSELKKTKFNKFGRFSDVDYDATDDQQKEDIMVTGPFEVVVNEGSWLNVREDHGTNKKVLRRLYAGDIVEVIDSYDNWLKILLDGGTETGWIYAKYAVPVVNDDQAVTDNEPDEMPKLNYRFVVTDEAGNVFRPVGGFTTDVEFYTE